MAAAKAYPSNKANCRANSAIVLKKAGKNPAQDALNRAEKLMGDAAQALALGDLPRAGTLQKDVLDALRKAARFYGHGAGATG